MMVIGTRASALALVQSRGMQSALAGQGHKTRLEHIVTQGDREQLLSLDKLEGKGFFTTEIETALLEGRIDIAVHSLKDLPADDAQGLMVAASPTRVDVRDTLVIRPEFYQPDAPHLPLAFNALIGTSAIRRKAQLAALRPDLRLYDLRGNVPTRLTRLREHRCDAVVLAEAGLQRLGCFLDDLVHLPLDPTVFVPAPGQGALALQCRRDDELTRQALLRLHDADDAELIGAERGLLRLLNAGCHVPLGAHAVRRSDGMIEMVVFFGGNDRSVLPFERRGHHFRVVASSGKEASVKAWRHLGAPIPAAAAMAPRAPRPMANLL